MDSQSPLSSESFERALINIVQSLPTFQRVQLLDYAILLQERLIGTSEAMPSTVTDQGDERLWGRAAIRSLAKYWDTQEEDDAWEYLQRET